MRCAFFLFLVFSFFTFALGQSTKHSVSISMPTVLQLRINGVETNSQTLNLNADKQGMLITPDVTRLEVFANTTWQLTVAVNSETKLQAVSNLQLVNLSPLPSVLLSGSKTKGWKEYEVSYQTATASKVEEQVTVSYILTQP